MATEGPAVLIIEHEKPMAKVIGNKLHARGIAVQLVPNEHEAQSLLSESKFDLIVLGLSMPEADSIALLSSWKAKGVPAPMVVLAKESQKQEEAEVRALGASKFLITTHVPVTAIVEEIARMLA